MFKELDPLLHSQLRLAIMSILLSVEEAEFVYIKEKTSATAGNLSVQLDKLNEAGYIEIEKGFAGKKPRTVCRITDKGRLAMEEYVNTLRQYFHIYNLSFYLYLFYYSLDFLYLYMVPFFLLILVLEI